MNKKDPKKANHEKAYLENKRFYHLTKEESYESILNSKEIQNKIILSYDSYFKTNPYSWFGKNANDPYNVEGVLRGMNASYYDNDFKRGACHMDLFPFATMTDYTKIKPIADRDILEKKETKEIFQEILEYLNPEMILVFGNSNFKYFSERFLNIQDKIPGISFKAEKGSCTIWKTNYLNRKLIGLSVNLGNPRGFDKVGLRDLGKKLIWGNIN